VRQNKAGFHNLRHSLSGLLITEQKSDVRTIKDMLRHSSSAMTIEFYTQSPMAQRIVAQEPVLRAILKPTIRRARFRTMRRMVRWHKVA
jgi:integrase